MTVKISKEELEQRKAVVLEAKTWIGTPYSHQGRIKGAGVDCGMLPIEVFEKCGLMEHIDVPYYNVAWHLHHGEEKYLGWVKKYCTEVTDREPLPGDMILYKYGRCISHSAMVTEWPQVIHAYVGQGVLLANAENQALKKKQVSIYSFWPIKPQEDNIKDSIGGDE
jgi:cell wall-associated NlpC family hydrolase